MYKFKKSVSQILKTVYVIIGSCFGILKYLIGFNKKILLKTLLVFILLNELNKSTEGVIHFYSVFYIWLPWIESSSRMIHVKATFFLAFCG